MRVKYRYIKQEKEASEEWKRTAFYLGLTILFFAAIAVFGIRILTSVAGIVGRFGHESSTQLNDTTPPPPPVFSNYPQVTNQRILNLNGSSEPNSTVKINFQGSERDVIVSDNGSFSTSITLEDGENKIQASSIDTSGNQSLNQTEIVVVYDDTEPELEISEPSDGASLRGKKQQELIIKGKTESGASIAVNDRKIILASDGSFETTFTLNEGENIFTFVAEDGAGNKTEVKRVVNYSS